jgi:hypothetical protein
MNSNGEFQWLRITFLGAPEKDGDREEITHTGDRLWLYVDGERWEYANIPSRFSQFSNLDYPQPEGDIVTGGWVGHEVIRKRADQPWLHLSRVYERLIAAKKLQWSFKSRNWADVGKETAAKQLSSQWQTTRYPIDNTGLQHAVSWCARQATSDAAYVLPDGIKRRMALKLDR